MNYLEKLAEEAKSQQLAEQNKEDEIETVRKENQARPAYETGKELYQAVEKLDGLTGKEFKELTKRRFANDKWNANIQKQKEFTSLTSLAAYGSQTEIVVTCKNDSETYVLMQDNRRTSKQIEYSKGNNSIIEPVILGKNHFKSCFVEALTSDQNPERYQLSQPLLEGFVEAALDNNDALTVNHIFTKIAFADENYITEKLQAHYDKK